MVIYLNKKRASISYRLIVCIILVVFVFGVLSVRIPFKREDARPSPTEAYAKSALPYMPPPTKLIKQSAWHNPPTLKGIKLYPDNPFKFDFIIDEGDNKKLTDERLKKESSKLIKYFLSSLTIPESDLWVNLSPHEQNRIAPNELGLTEMGKDLLGEDYVLKQLTASLTYPESPLGKKYWKRVYQRALTLFGTTKIPINTFNKVWIVPDTAVVYQDDTRAIIGDTHLKVMLEEDYLALKNRPKTQDAKLKTKKLTEKDVEQINNFTSQITKELILPRIEEDVNYGKNFTYLRQIYNSLILAAWFKQKLKESIISKIYVDKKKIKGVDVHDSQIKEKIYNQYLEAYKKGVYNYIKADYDPSSRRNIRRKYYSGGFTAVDFSSSALTMLPLTKYSEPTITSSNKYSSSSVTVELLSYVEEKRDKQMASSSLKVNKKGLKATVAALVGSAFLFFKGDLPKQNLDLKPKEGQIAIAQMQTSQAEADKSFEKISPKQKTLYIDKLLKDLKHSSDTKVRKVALETLANTIKSDFDSHFSLIVRLLNDNDAGIKKVVIKTLRDINSPKIVPVLINVALNDNDHSVRYDASVALSYSSEKNQIVQQLMPELKTSDSERLYRVVELLPMGYRASKLNNRIKNALKQMLEFHKAEDNKLAIVRGLRRRFSDPEIESIFINLAL